MTGVEHILVAMKPCDGSFADNALKFGVAGLWIEGTRLGKPRTTHKYGNFRTSNHGSTMNEGFGVGACPSPSGRWPANVILGHSQKCLRLGTKKVKGTGAKDNRGQPHSKYRFQGEGTVRSDVWTGPVDEDGNEVIENWDCVESCPTRLIGEQSGTLRSGGKKGSVYTTEKRGIFGEIGAQTSPCISDAGTAARFFKQVGEYDEDNG